MCMATKTITIMEDAYKLLLNRKYKHESFSEVIRRTLHKDKDVMKFAGAWKHISDKEAEEMKERIASIRRKSTIDLLKRLNKDDMYRY